MPTRDHQYWIYILASQSRRLYTGVTNDLARRVSEHRAGVGSAFTKRYKIHRLVHFEEHRDIRDAIQREKEIKAWRREKKIRLIESRNAGWLDLAPSSPAARSPLAPEADPASSAGMPACPSGCVTAARAACPSARRYLWADA